MKFLFVDPDTKAAMVAPLVGAWIEINIYKKNLRKQVAVAPLVGAWIEITGVSDNAVDFTLSLPSWERGLKLRW